MLLDSLVGLLGVDSVIPSGKIWICLLYWRVVGLFFINIIRSLLVILKVLLIVSWSLERQFPELNLLFGRQRHRSWFGGLPWFHIPLFYLLHLERMEVFMLSVKICFQQNLRLVIWYRSWFLREIFRFVTVILRIVLELVHYYLLWRHLKLIFDRHLLLSLRLRPRSFLLYLAHHLLYPVTAGLRHSSIALVKWGHWGVLAIFSFVYLAVIETINFQAHHIGVRLRGRNFPLSSGWVNFVRFFPSFGPHGIFYLRGVRGGGLNFGQFLFVILAGIYFLFDSFLNDIRRFPIKRLVMLCKGIFILN